MKTTKFEERLRVVQEVGSTTTAGENKVLRAYYTTKQTTESDTLVIFDSFFPSELPEIVLALKELEVEEIIITCKSTALMDTLQYLINEGWEVSGTAEVNLVTGSKSKLTGLLMKCK